LLEEEQEVFPAMMVEEAVEQEDLKQVLGFLLLLEFLTLLLLVPVQEGLLILLLILYLEMLLTQLYQLVEEEVEDLPQHQPQLAALAEELTALHYQVPQELLEEVPPEHQEKEMLVGVVQVLSIMGHTSEGPQVVEVEQVLTV
jgi:hypothetical protein